MKILLLYYSRDGHTQAIATHIAGLLQDDKKTCDVVDLSSADINPDNYQCVIIGAPVHYGHFNPALFHYINRYTEQLNRLPGAFFAVNLTARKPEKRSPQTNVYVRKFLQKIPWKPQLCEVFAGALRYPRYRWFDRLMIQFIMRMTGGETDRHKEIDYTDWQQVSNFSKKINQLYLAKP